MRARNWPFSSSKTLIGMVHVGALPGTPSNETTVDLLAAQAAAEALALAETGFDAIILENMHDCPFVHGDDLGPEIIAGMTRVALEVIHAVELPLGIQILSGGNRQALAVAQACDASFIRCENFVYAHVADEGLLPKAEAGGLLRYRRSIGAQDIAVFCDIKKKHASHAITADLSIAEIAEAAEFFGADALIVTGSMTAHPTDPDDLALARKGSSLPLVVGSGVTPEQVGPLVQRADALIVGSWIKTDGHWSNPVDPTRCGEMVVAFRAARDGQG